MSERPSMYEQPSVDDMLSMHGRPVFWWWSCNSSVESIPSHPPMVKVIKRNKIKEKFSGCSYALMDEWKYKQMAAITKDDMKDLTNMDPPRKMIKPTDGVGVRGQGRTQGCAHAWTLHTWWWRH